MSPAERNNVVLQLAIDGRAYDDSHPDVGPGWHDEHFVEQALARMGWSKDEIAIDWVLTRMKRKH